MVETLEHQIWKVNEHPRQSRRALYRELLRSETFLLNLGTPLNNGSVRLSRGRDPFFVWADKDPELGGVWVPVFPARDTVARYVSSHHLKAPSNREFLWMEHDPGQVFSLLRGVGCFAGLRLFLDGQCSVSLPWSDVKALSEGKIPDDTPKIYDSPIQNLKIPSQARIAFGHVPVGPDSQDERLLCVPEAGHFHAEDLRKLVRIPLGGGEAACMACRHFLQVLRFMRGPQTEYGTFLEDLLRALMTFEMFGEAEALCEWLERKGNEVYSWIFLTAIYGKSGKLDDCVDLCKRAEAKYQGERSFPVNRARALMGLGRLDEARDVVQNAAKRFPEDPLVRRLVEEL